MTYKPKHARHTSFQWINKMTSLLSLTIALYLLMPPILSHYNNQRIISTYQNTISQINSSDKAIALEKAREYNELLFQTKGMIVPGLTDQMLTDAYYLSLLNLSDTSYMARLEIPIISVNLPIYHGTSEESLSNGVGHLQGSSLPVGGKHTRTILSGHRASPKAELFSRLDELKEGDFVFIEVIDQKLAYRVKTIDVIEPEDVDILEIVPDKDLVTLVTCTPYGTNRYRLIIYCERVDGVESENIEIKKNVSVREPAIRVVTPLLLLFFAEEIWWNFPIMNKLYDFVWILRRKDKVKE